MDNNQSAEDENLLSLVSDGKEALYHATRAAEFYMKAVADAATTAERSRLYCKFSDIASHAERLKASRFSSPVRQDFALDAEYWESYPCTLHGVEFPPWRPPDSRLFRRQRGEPRYVDPTDFNLSTEQAEMLDRWQRPDEIFSGQNLPDVSNDQDKAPDSDPFMRTEEGVDLVQDATADCSVVASLCASLRFMLSGPQSSSMLSSIMFPFDSVKGQPALSPSGMHLFRLHFNGCYRQVVIDDRLPCSRTGRLMYVTDRHKPSLIWPALLEKAYLKVRGGYDFPGSNSSTDLFVITGWIPEQLFLQSEDFDSDDAWNRIEIAFKTRQVFVTLGTGHVPEPVSRATGLVSQHDYAVLDLDTDDGGRRRLLVKDPWRDGHLGLLREKSSVNAAEPASPRAPIAFWITMEQAVMNFQSMYVNWDPAMFSHREDVHFSWTRPPAALTRSLAYNRQFAITSPSDTDVWVLLSRHFSDEETKLARENLASGANPPRKAGFMSIMAFYTDGKRVNKTEGAVFKSPYVDSPHTLVQLRLEPGRACTIVPVHQDLPLAEYSFTLSFFSGSVLQVRRAMEDLSFHITRLGCWTRRTGGGNPSFPSYLQNPQYSLKVRKATELSVLLSTDDVELPIRADLVWSNGERVEILDLKNLVSPSGDYDRGCSLVRARVDAGVYTIVCSTYVPGHAARFALRIGSQFPIDIAEIPPRIAGRLCNKLPPLVFDHGCKMRRIGIRPKRLTKAIVRIQPPKAVPPDGPVTPPSAFKIIALQDWFPHHQVLAVSSGNQFRELNRVISTPEFDINPHQAASPGLWVLVEQAADHAPSGPLDVQILCDHPVTIKDWENC